MIAKIGQSLVNLDEILYISQRSENPHLADIKFKNGGQIVLSTGDKTVEQWCEANAPAPAPPRSIGRLAPTYKNTS